MAESEGAVSRKPYRKLGVWVVNVWSGHVGVISEAVPYGCTGWEIKVTYGDGSVHEWFPCELWRHHFVVPAGWSLAGKLPCDKVRHLALRALAMEPSFAPLPGCWVCAFAHHDVGLSHLYRTAEQIDHAFCDEITVKYEASRGGVVLAPCLVGKRFDKDFVAETVAKCCDLYEDWIQTCVDEG